jgi:hypothetical protein
MIGENEDAGVLIKVNVSFGETADFGDHCRFSG